MPPQNSAAKPSGRVRVRMYNVGFGDCFLLSIPYKAEHGGPRHILIDFGSTGLPAGAPSDRMLRVARDIAAECGGQLTAVVATHRHKDHISGFAPAKNGKGPGNIIAGLKPRVVIQPWTEHPKAKPDATAPPAVRQRARSYVLSLREAEQFAARALDYLARLRGVGGAEATELRFQGENNLANLKAVKNLMAMGKKGRAAYVRAGSSSGLETLLPGVKVHVLGPPTLEQTDTIRKQKHRDEGEFWHLHLRIARWLGAAAGRRGLRLRAFRGARGVSLHSAPPAARWFARQMDELQVSELLAIVRELDKALNNTSVILLFQIGRKRLLFPGDAQIENWRFALDQKKNQKLLAGVGFYKVGHHGSLNATPRSLWNLFKKKSDDPAKKRLISLCSTMEGKHGSVAKNTEVPRRTLVAALEGHSDYQTTQQKGSAPHTDRGFAPGQLFADVFL